MKIPNEIPSIQEVIDPIIVNEPKPDENTVLVRVEGPDDVDFWLPLFRKSAPLTMNFLLHWKISG